MNGWLHPCFIPILVINSPYLSIHIYVVLSENWRTWMYWLITVKNYYFEVSPIQTQLRSGACSLRWSAPRTPGLCLDATGSGAGPDGPDGSSADAHAQIGEGWEPLRQDASMIQEQWVDGYMQFFFSDILRPRLDSNLLIEAVFDILWIWTIMTMTQWFGTKFVHLQFLFHIGYPGPQNTIFCRHHVCCRRFGEETYHVSVSQCAPNQPGLMEVAAPLPATHAMDPASPARPMVASAALPHSAVAPAATPMQGLPAATVNARPGPEAEWSSFYSAEPSWSRVPGCWIWMFWIPKFWKCLFYDVLCLCMFCVVLIPTIMMHYAFIRICSFFNDILCASKMLQTTLSWHFLSLPLAH